MYKAIDIKEAASLLEGRVQGYWTEKDLVQKSEDFREGAPRFVFFEGPPTANGKPGIHHVMGRTLKDSVCRYKTMKGFQVKRKAGWDTHGLPVEIEVEKQLGLKDKKEVEAYGIAEFNKKCKESVFTYENLWRKMTEKMGYWINLDNPYITLDNDYIETLWWILNEFFKQDLIYKGHKIVPYCPSCGTPLSSHEVAQGYKDVDDPSVFVKFKSTDEDNLYYLAWTTTPWTLISNVALVVNPKETYVKVLHNEQHLILAKARLEVLEGDYEIVEEFNGKSLEYKAYEPLFRYVEPDKKAWYIGCADYVTMADGTGVVHTAPAFGQDDYALGMKYGLPFIQPVDSAGKFTDVVTEWAGVFVKDADKGIIKVLKEKESLYKRLQIKHSYPHCWRCSSPLVYYARESWYIRTQKFKDQLMENNSKINWVPSFVGEKRFGAWLENNIDWALSRDRFWGTPLNIWVCDDCGKLESAGSIAELREKGTMLDGSAVPDDIELHRPYVDNVEFTCSCGSKMHRTKEVIDCWFDSGAMPFAQWHYPFENKDIFDDQLFPADFISEGIDQTRGWFYTLLTISTILKGKAPFKNVLVNDLILDKKGVKMSKSKGNAVDPMQLMDKYGADAIRWYLVSSSVPWVPTKFDTKGVEEVVGKFIGTLKNVYSFFVTYTNIDGFNASEHTFNENQSLEIDRWIISRLNTVIKQVTESNDGYDFTKSLRTIQEFVLDEVSNWYVRRSRRRFWAMELTDDKKTAYLTLNHILVNVSQLMAPFAPYLAEDIYTNLTGNESVHLTEYPVGKDELIDAILETEMKTIIDLVSLGRAARNTSQIKVRQTLQRLFVPESSKAVVERMLELIKEEINVKEIEYISENDDFVHFEMKANFKVMGPKFGKNMKKLAAHLSTLNGGDILDSFKEGKPFSFELEGETFEIVEEDVAVSIQQREGFVFESSKDNYVALDTTLNEDLILEGYARELVNKIQFTRKENKYDIMDRIEIKLSGDDEIKKAVELHKDYICSETLANSMEFSDDPDMTEWDINGKQVHIILNKN